MNQNNQKASKNISRLTRKVEGNLSRKLSRKLSKDSQLARSDVNAYWVEHGTCRKDPVLQALE
jgi:hypothetical protein